MTLNEALGRVRQGRSRGQAKVHVLVCGFQPLHLGTFLHAYLQEPFPADHVEIETGLYGDFAGNLEKAASSSAIAAAVTMEWSDLDPRLGLRSAGGWSNRSKDDVLSNLTTRLAQISAAIRNLSARMPVAFAPPGLPLPPIGNTIRAQSSGLELEIAYQLDGFLVDVAKLPGVRVVDRSHLEQLSPQPGRLDAKMELLAGFPYSITHAGALARSLAHVLYPPPPKKGLITDLDDTLWAGLVGEVGCDAVSWHQDSHTQIHGLYQQMLGHLADSGVLIGVSSKNELDLVQTTLARKDLLVGADVLFPVLASWGPKSRAVGEILRTWNIGAESVVFVDDNPMELSEVREAFPALTCLQFPKSDAARLWSFLGELRDLFGKPVLLEEDRIRRASIRASSEVREATAGANATGFLRSLSGTVTLDYRKNPADKRPLELINKTNQFNLNGVRLTEGEWQRCLERSDTVAVVVSYQDKFGPLGKIGVVMAQRKESVLKVLHWVMSCRAFSRHIEHHTIDSLFRQTDAAEIEFSLQPTDRNQPLQEFFESLGSYKITRAQFASNSGPLPHQVSQLE